MSIVHSGFVYVMPVGSNIDVARCGWDARIMSNSKIGGAVLTAHINECD
ncbi:MAG: hypothetical protein K2N54_07430 [Helicobacter sp.]|nr:hypothetical protein [Helicobacter sp.]